MLGAASGAVAGLVAITPAAGNVGIPGAFVIGIAAGFVCLWGVNGLKRMLKVDDSLDVSPVHGVGGLIGTLLTGVFVSASLGGAGLAEGVSIGDQVLTQLIGIVAAILWCGILTWLILKLVDAIVGLRVPDEQETEGLDLAQHGERGYSS